MDYMFLPLKRYADFSGRSRRMEYWMWTLFQFGIGILFIVMILAVGGSAMMLSGGDPSAALAAGGAVMVILALNWLVSLAFLIPNLAVTVRRLHDTNRSGWWIMLPLVPYIVTVAGTYTFPDALLFLFLLATLGGGITLLVFMFLDGTPGPNQYGDDPKDRGTANVFA